MTPNEFILAAAILVTMFNVAFIWWNNRWSERQTERLKAIRSVLDHQQLMGAMVWGWKIARERPLQALPPMEEFARAVEGIIHDNRAADLTEDKP